MHKSDWYSCMQPWWQWCVLMVGIALVVAVGAAGLLLACMHALKDGWHA